MFKHLLVPLDGSELSEVALPPALELATCLKSKVTLLRVVHPPYFLAASGSDFTELYTIFREDMQQEAANYIKDKQTALQAEGYRVGSRIVEGDSVADSILNTADELAVDTIVMSTHGRGGLSRFVFGSVADKVLKHAKVPLLLIRAQNSKEENDVDKS